MTEIIINEELKSLIPPLSETEYSQLEENIIADGVREPLVLWKDTLIDGHNRYEICHKHNLGFNSLEKEFSDIEEAKIWIIDNQLGRRNLPLFVRTELALKKEESIAARAKERMESGVKPDPVTNSAQGRTRNAVAKIAGVGADTVAKTKKILEKADDETKKRLRSGETSINAVYKDITNKVHVSNNSGNNEWYTPVGIIESARMVMGEIDLDPASSEIANRVVRAEKYYTAEDDGLKHKWKGRIWMNPPYAQPLIGHFCEKMRDSVEAGCTGIALVNNATETSWFQTIATVASAICFPKGRIRFIDMEGRPSGAPLQGQAILYFGDDSDTFIKYFKKIGVVLVK